MPSSAVLSTSKARAIPFALRKANIDAATRHLRQRGILVDIPDRQAPIRFYRVTGKRDLMLAEDVIELASGTGFEVML